MSANGRNARAKDDMSIDPLVIIGMLDHSVSYALAGIVDPDVGVATFDYRLDFADTETRIVGDIFAETKIIMMSPHSATVQGKVYDENDSLIATGTTLFRLGGFPGGVPPIPDLMGGFDPSLFLGPFQTLLGFKEQDNELFMTANNPATVGWESAGSIHGGAIGALLMAACQHREKIELESADTRMRLASIHINFLRPANTKKPLYSVSKVKRLGRSGSFIEAECHQDPAKSVASAEATFIPILS